MHGILKVSSGMVNHYFLIYITLYIRLSFKGYLEFFYMINSKIAY